MTLTSILSLSEGEEGAKRQVRVLRAKSGQSRL